MSEHDQSELRREALTRRRKLSTAERQYFSRKIAIRFIHSRWFYRSRSIGIYLSMRDEVQTSEIILRSWRAKKDVFVPVLEKNSGIQFRQLKPESVLSRKRYGIAEPVDGEFVSAEKLDVVLVPLAAFDEIGNRIGMGGGYYDRCFAFMKTRNAFRKPKLVGLAYSCQRVKKIPTNPWDIPLCTIISEKTGKR